MKKYSKKGKGGKVVAVIVTAVLLVGVIVALFLFNVIQFPGQSVTGGVQTTNSGNGGVNVVTSNPVINVNAYDKYQTGTSVTVSARATYDLGTSWTTYSGITLGTTTIAPGNSLGLIVNGSGYHSAVVNPFTVAVSGSPFVTSGPFVAGQVAGSGTTTAIPVYLNKNASVTSNIYSTTGIVLTNNGGTSNQTGLGNGAVYNFKDEMTAGASTSTQDMVCLIEMTDGGNITQGTNGVTYTQNGASAPFSSQAKPTWYTLNATGSALWLFSTSPVANGVLNTFNIQVNSAPTKKMVASDFMIKHCYSKEYFIDAGTGKLVYDITDSLGNAQYGNDYKYVVTFG